jgi:hypothetical protein
VSEIGDIIYPLGRPERVLERELITIQPAHSPDGNGAAPAPIQYYALKTEPVEDHTADAQA